MHRKLLISLLLSMLYSSQAWAEVVIIVRQKVEATGNYVRICDVARVEGPREQALEVAKTVLGPTPPRGQIKEITRWEIEHRLFEMGFEAKVSFTGNDSVRVTGNGTHQWNSGDFADGLADSLAARDGQGGELPGYVPQPLARLPQEASPVATRREETPQPATEAAQRPTAVKNPLAMMNEETRKRVASAVSSFIAGRYRRPDVEVETKVLSLSGLVPEDAREVAVEEALEGRVPGKAGLSLRVVDRNGKTLPPITVAVESEVYALAPVAAKPLYKGEVLKPRDVLVTRIQMKAGQTYLPPDAKAVEGREVQRTIQPGAPILASEATPTAAVKRGNLVVVDAAGKGWRLQATAKALGTGNVDDIITVEDVSTKTKYQARVTGHGTVAAIARTGIDQLNNKL